MIIEGGIYMNKKSILGFLSGFVTYLLLSFVDDFFNLDFKELIVIVMIIFIVIFIIWKKSKDKQIREKQNTR